MSTERTLVIHSGTFKTGSTAIQLYLNRANHHGVLAAEGARYPQMGRIHSIQHANLVAELRKERVFLPANGGWDRLLADITAGEHQTTVVSSEGLSLLDATQMRRIGDLCRTAGVAVRWIHYVREQAGFLNAYYVERLVNLRPDLAMMEMSLEDFAGSDHVDLSFLNYATFIDQVRTAVPEVDLRVRPFSRDLLAGGDVVADFCEVAGLPYDPEHGGHTNVGTGWRTVETARRLIPSVKGAHLRGQLVGVPGRPAARQRWLQLIRSELVKASTEVGWNTESARYLTEESSARLMARYAEENARLDAGVDFPWLDVVASTSHRPSNVGDYADIPGDEVLEVVSRVLRVLYRMPEEIAALAQRKQEPPVAPRSSARRVAGAFRRRLRR